jgi:hypothetical protein
MKKILILALLIVCITTLAHAQATRTWVSGVGDDVNPCSRTAPCKTFAGAISKTASPGIINCLDPGGFGAVTITKDITIDCTGTLGSVLSSGVQGIVINALTSHNIVLRAIDINGAGTTLGTNGVNVIQAKSVTLSDVNIANYSGKGLVTTNTSNNIPVMMSHCEVINISVQGVQALSTAPGTSQIMINNSHISNCVNGVDIAGSGNSGSVSYSVLEKNSGAGFQVEQTGSSGSLESVTLRNNGTGVAGGVAANTPTVRLSRCLITNNTANGITGTATTCFSNNVIAGNVGSNTCGSAGNAQQ